MIIFVLKDFLAWYLFVMELDIKNMINAKEVWYEV